MYSFIAPTKCRISNIYKQRKTLIRHVSVKMYNSQRVYLPRLKPGAVGEIMFARAHNLQYDLHFISVVYIKCIRAVYKIV